MKAKGPTPRITRRITMAKKNQKIQLCVAVVARDDSKPSLRHDGDFSCFVGEEMHEVIERAIYASHKWASDPAHNWGPYVVYTGTLTAQVREQHRYKMEPL